MFNMVAFYAKLLIRSLMNDGKKYYIESFFSTEISGVAPESYWRVVVVLVTPDGLPKGIDEQ